MSTLASFVAFGRRHLVPIVTMAIAVVLWAFGVVNNSLQVLSLRLTGEQMQLVGGALFVVSVVSILFHWHTQQDYTVGRTTTLAIETPVCVTGEPYCYWRLPIKNSGDEPVQNAQLRLLGMAPTIRALEAYLPSAVARKNAIEADQFRPCVINPGDREHYELVKGWVSGSGEFFVEGLKGVEPNPSMRPLCLSKAPQEWTLTYEMTAANAAPQRFQVSLRIQGSQTIYMSLASS